MKKKTMSKSILTMPKGDIFKHALSRALSEEKVLEIMEEATKQYGDLYAERRLYSNRELRQHLEESILPGVALFRALADDRTTQGMADQLIEEVFDEWGKVSRKPMERLGKVPIFYCLMRFLVKSMMRVSFPEEGWDTEWVEVSGKEISFNMNKCFYFDVLQEYGVSELTRQYCRLDDLIYENVSPGVKWDRKKTLGRGDACCDFRFVRVGKK
jgi:hypothetical protein